MLRSAPTLAGKPPSVRRNFLTHTQRDRLTFLLMAASLLVAFAPVFTVPYAFLDDYSFLFKSVEHRDLSRFVENMMFFVRDGRTLNGLLILLPFRLAGRVEALSAIRFLGALGVVSLASVVFSFLRSLRWSRSAAALLTLGLATLPPLLLFSSWTQQWPLPWAAALAGMSSVLLWRRIHSRTQSASVVVVAFLLLVTGFQIHQALMSFFWFFFAAVWLTAKCADARKIRFLRISLLVYGLAAAFEYATIRVPAALGITTLNPRGALTSDLLAKLKWFVTNPLMDASSLWLVQPSVKVSYASLILGATGLILIVSRKPTLLNVGRALLALVILPLTYLSNLVVVVNWASYRTQSALSATVLLLIACCFRQIGELFPPFSGTLRKAGHIGAVAASFAMLFAARGSLEGYMVIPQNREFVAVSSAINQRYTPQLRSLTIIQPDWSDSLASVQRYDEFGIPSHFAQWVPIPFAKLVLHEHGLAFDNLSEIRSTLRPVNQPQDTLADGVINVAALFTSEHRVLTATLPQVTEFGPQLLKRLRETEAAYARLRRDTGHDTNQIADLVANYSGLPNWQGPYLPGIANTETPRTGLKDEHYSLFGLQTLQRAEGGFRADECGGNVWTSKPIQPLNLALCAVYVTVAPIPVGDMLFLARQVDEIDAAPGQDYVRGRLRVFMAGGAILYQLP